MMDTERVNDIINDIHKDYDLNDPLDVIQLIMDILYTLDKDEFSIAIASINSINT